LACTANVTLCAAIRKAEISKKIAMLKSFIFNPFGSFFRPKKELYVKQKKGRSCPQPSADS
jgi:hypothetical protein